MSWDYTQYPIGHYDIIYASPQCTAFSRANPHPVVSEVEHAVDVVKRCFQIIQYFQPVVWLLENPVNRLQDMPFMQQYRQYLQTTSYCLFGTRYRKDTNLWSNIDVCLHRCVGSTTCKFKTQWGFHEETAQTGSTRLANGALVQGTHPQRVQQMPFALLQHLFQYVSFLY